MSSRCYPQFNKVWAWQVLVQTVLIAICSVAFWGSKWIALKRAAAVLLPVGMVASMVVFDWLFTKALNM